MRRCCAEDPILLDEALDLLANHAEGIDPVDGADPWARRAEVPASVGPWRVLGLVGQGGMGIVYRARRVDDEAGGDVALKVLRAALVGGQSERRFQREIEALRRLDHPGIARLLDAGTAPDGTPWLATEFVEGVTLARWRVESGASPGERVRLVAELCDAVQAAHDLGIVHRDLKPENVIVTPEGRPKVLDFGIARLQAEESSLATLATQTWQLLGTIRYMSPEQASGGGGAIDARSDVYTLGVIAYELLAGTLPYDLARLSTPRALLEITTAEPRPLGARDGALDLVLQHALAKDPARRYATAAEMAADLRRHLVGRPVSVRRPGPWSCARRELRARPRLRRALVAAVAAGIVAGAALLARLADRQPAPTWRSLLAGIEQADQLRHSGPSTRANWEEAIALFRQAALDLGRMPETPWRHDLDRYLRWRLGELHFFVGELEHDHDALEQARGYWRDAAVVPWRRGTALGIDEASTVREKVLRLGWHHPRIGGSYAIGAKALLREPAANWLEAARGYEAALLLLSYGDENYHADPTPDDRIARSEDLAWARLNLAVARGAWGATIDSLEVVEDAADLLAEAVPPDQLTANGPRSIIIEARGTLWLRRADLLAGAGRAGEAAAALDSATAHLARALELRGAGAGRSSWRVARALAQAATLRDDLPGPLGTPPPAALEETLDQVRAALRPGLDDFERAQTDAALGELAARRAAVSRDTTAFARAESLLAAAAPVLDPRRFPVPAADLGAQRAAVARLRFGATRAPADSAAAVTAISTTMGVIPRAEYPALHRRLRQEAGRLAAATRDGGRLAR